MENMLRTFTDERFGSVRTVLRDGEPWFVAADVCRALELSNPTVSVGRLDDDERAKFNLGRQGEGTIVSEPGLYTLVLGSRKPEAKAFKRWITHEVIPAIRKHGGYLTPEAIEEAITSPDFLIRLATTLKEEQEKNRKLAQENAQLAKRIEEMTPDVELAQAALQSGEADAIGNVADMYGTTAQTLNKILWYSGIQKKGQNGKARWELTAKYAEKGYTDTYAVSVSPWKRAWQMNWTFRGIQFIYTFFKENFGLYPMKYWHFDGTDVKPSAVLKELKKNWKPENEEGVAAV
jgi:prophage antirepressor-like protein|nr:MAG TPA: repressor domain protein [Caudoviricetes sp.]